MKEAGSEMNYKNFVIIFLFVILFTALFVIFASENSKADLAEDLVEAILLDDTLLVKNSAKYDDNDNPDHRQAKVFTSPMGILSPTRGTSSYILMSTGIAGSVPVTTDEEDPGDERGTWFRDRYGYPRDYAKLEMELEVPANMYYLEYDIRFLSAEYPEYVATKYNDKVEITVDSPSQGITINLIDVARSLTNANLKFDVKAQDMPDTGFDIFATSGDPEMVDIVTRTPNLAGDAGATNLLDTEDLDTMHPVSPGEIIEVTFEIKDAGDNLLDSAVFIDGLRFIEQPMAKINTQKDLQDLNGGLLLFNDTIQYTIDINNTGNVDQGNNDGHEFEDKIPDNTIYVDGSAYATSGTIDYDAGENKITWDGSIASSSNVTITFNVTVNDNLACGTIISNQGKVYWDSTGDGINDATKYTNLTTIVVRSVNIENELIEDFTDDVAGTTATDEELCSGRVWFGTSEEALGCDFEVAPSYHYLTANSFKTQLRAMGGSFYWNYSLSQIYNLSDYNDTDWWEIWFKCESTSEDGDLYIEFENTNNEVIAKLKFEYCNNGINPPMDWLLNLYSYNFSGGQWELLTDDYISGWYRLKIGKNSPQNVSYFLYNTVGSQIGNKIYEQASLPFSNLARVKWYSTMNPIVCPMFFWDEHILYLS